MSRSSCLSQGLSSFGPGALIALICLASAPMPVRADDTTPASVQAPFIQVPALEGIVGAPSKDLEPPTATTAATPATTASTISPGPATDAQPQPSGAAPVTDAPVKDLPVKDVPVQAAAPTVPVAPAPFELAAEITERLTREKSPSTARDDRDAAAKFYEARLGAPLWTTATGLTPAAQALVAEIGRAGDYALSADAFKLPAPLPADAARTDLADAEVTLTMAALKYARHARGGRVDPQALSKAIDRKAQLLPPAKVLQTLALADKPDVALRGFHPQHPQFEKLRQKYLAAKAGEIVIEQPAPAQETAKSKKTSTTAPKPPSAAAIERKLLVNLEMWRWMPEFGPYYVQANIPDFTVRVVKNGSVIHAERIVTGKPETMTPIFSDEMRLVVFKPFWNVPESIKYKELQPQLMRGGSLERSGLRAEINGRRVDSTAIDWAEVDMRHVHVFQPPGEANALGRVKFLFPNKHDVYLHDTPSKGLFASSSRAFSHGCVRVRDPLKLAEVILGSDKNMSRAEIDGLANAGPENNEVRLARPLPIHLTYFTAWVDDAGKLQTAADIYGHENRVQLGLEGKTHLIVQPREDKFTPPSAEDRRRFAEQRQQKQGGSVEKFFKDIFNF